MNKSRIAWWLLCVAALALVASATNAQDYPNKPLRFITGGAGGGGDFVARLVAQGLSGNLGQQVIVDNRPSNISPDVAAKAAPDGYSLLVGTAGLWLTPFMQGNTMTVDVLRDFTPITVLGTSPFVVTVHAGVPAGSIKELIALAKAKPGALNYGSGPPGGISGMAIEVFKSMAGVNIVYIAYKNDTLLYNDLLAGRVEMTFGSASSIMPLVKAGKLKALAVTSAKPSVLLPGLPAISATVPGYQMGSTYGLLAPAKTPGPIIRKMHQESVRVLNVADVRERLLDAGVEPGGGTPEDFMAHIKSEMSTIGKVIKESGIRIE